ncbi:MAG: hypothetical protein L0214_08595 [candidate division NC10 bacterium]|nr:hypothetical protein [candidate division NC10 bacterium]
MAFRRGVLSLVLLLQAAPAAAQQPDGIKLRVEEGGRETGRETFTLQPGRGRGAPGSTLSASARYPASAPTTQLQAVLERTPDFSLAKFQLEVESPTGPTVILAAGSGARLIVRTVAKGSESGRELPGGPDVVLLDDGVHSLFATVADLASPGGRRLTAIFPRSGKRASFTARREAGGDGGMIRVALTGDIAGTLVTDPQGRLERLELPGRGLVVTRVE